MSQEESKSRTAAAQAGQKVSYAPQRPPFSDPLILETQTVTRTTQVTGQNVQMIRTSGNPPHIGAVASEIPHSQISNVAQDETFRLYKLPNYLKPFFSAQSDLHRSWSGGSVDWFQNNFSVIPSEITKIASVQMHPNQQLEVSAKKNSNDSQDQAPNSVPRNGEPFNATDQVRPSNFSDAPEEHKNQEAQIHDGNFKTPRPESLEPKDCEDIEKIVRGLLKLHKEGGADEVAQKHANNQEDLLELQDDLAYYLKLYREAFTGPGGPDPVMESARLFEPMEKLKNAYQFLDEAKLRGEKIKVDSFKVITKYSSTFDEEGRCISDKKKYFHEDENKTSDNFDELIRDQVYKLLKYRGSFRSMITSKYFISPEQKNQFYYNASLKVPFYFIYECSLNIQKELMAKYLENPFNTMICISYNQRVDGFPKLDAKDPRVERTVHLDKIYCKSKSHKPNLLCIGNPGTRKSSVINFMIQAQFEVMEEGAAGLFHDSVDALFHSKDNPIGFNVFDFQGEFANKDYKLIGDLLNYMPTVYLLVQVTEPSYITDVLGKLDEEIRNRFAKRILVITKNTDSKQTFKIKGALREIFKDFDVKSQIKDLGNSFSGPSYENACRTIFDKLRNDLQQTEFYNNELVDFEARIRQKYPDRSEHEYKHFTSSPNSDTVTEIYGTYWLLTDSMCAMREGKQCEVLIKDEQFRKSHMRVKNFLLKCSSSPEQLKGLTRALMFPLYIKALNIRIIDKQLAKRDLLARSIQDELIRKKEKLTLEPSNHGPLFQTYMNALLEGETDQVSDILELVESHYLPRITSDQNTLRAHKVRLENINAQIYKFEQSPGKIKDNTSDEDFEKYNQLLTEKTQSKAQMDQVMSNIEEKVLDSDLFLREAKKYIASKDEATQAEFNQVLSQAFEDGNALEIIDGDIDSIEISTFTSVINWVQNLQKNNNKLLVVTIMGPQSSGKSTLLNILFGAKFHVSAGRCTKGLNAMLLRTDFQETKEILILDSEGLFSIERSDPMYDRRLAIFCMSVSNLLLINIKGELNIEIEKVLQVAIYALKRIAEVNAILRKVRIQFILRDQVEMQVSNMESAFILLKESLMKAAQAAGAQLHDLVFIPDKPEKIITMFPSAISVEQVNGNDNFQQNKSTDVFRQACSKLRLTIFDLSRELEDEQRIVSLVAWGSDTINVWTAVQNNDDLMLIRDLDHINNHRSMIIAIANFQQIMSRPAPVNEEEQKMQYENPLMPGKAVEGQENLKFISANMTIFAQFDTAINDALLELNQARFKKRNLDNFGEEKMRDFIQMLAKFEETYMEQAKILTEKMNPELSQQAQNLVRVIVGLIFRKSMVKWKESQANATLENFLEESQNNLKQRVLDSRINRNNLTPQQFEQEVNNLVKVTRTSIINKFLKNTEEQRKEAANEFDLMVQRENKGEEQKGENVSIQKVEILKRNPDCLNNWLVILTEIEKGDARKTSNLQQMTKYSQINYNSLNPAIENYLLKTDKQLQNALRPIEVIEDKLKQGYGFGEYLQNTRKKDEQTLKSLKEQYEKQFQKKQSKIQGQAEKDIWNMMEQHWQNLRHNVQEIKRDLQQYREGNPKPMNFPQEYEHRFLKKFYQENERQKQEMNLHTPIMKQEDFARFIKYDTARYLADFNTIIFNELLEQAQHNEKIKINELNVKLDQVKVKAMECYEKINSKFDSDEAVIKNFIELIIQHLITELQKDQLKKLNTKMYGVDAEITKAQIIAECNSRFQEAQDQQTIILHITSPVELEKAIFNKKYTDFQIKYAEEARDQFEQQVKTALKRCQDFLQKVYQALKNKGTLNEEITASQKLDFLQYLYGTLIQGLAAQNDSLKEKILAFVNKKQDCERHGFYEQLYVLPTQIKGIFREQVNSVSYNDNAFSQDGKELELIAQKLKDITYCIEQLQFNVDDQQCVANKVISKIRQEFEADLLVMEKKRVNFDHAQEQALGCMAECFFCGARCSEINSCDSNNRSHRTNYHRPMAFKGTNEITKEGTKQLVKDFCTSSFNLNESKWDKPNGDKTPVHKLLERMSMDYNLKVSGMNVVLQWDTGSDLDIQVRCGCGNWHGYGTSGGSQGTCICETCDMKRDHDVRTGADGRAGVFEHVYFKTPTKIYGKTIGMAVHNWEQNSTRPRNNFKMALINQWGYQLFPNAGGQDIKHDRSWMFTSNVTGQTSEQKEYTFQQDDDNLGSANYFNNFITHAARTVEHGGKWEFNKSDAVQNQTDLAFKQYSARWNEKWQLVKDILCGKEHYNCEVLDSVLDV